MSVIVYAEHFRAGEWNVWEHRCSQIEAEAVWESVCVKAHERKFNNPLTHKDILDGARQMFNVERGSDESPEEGDIRVYCICIDSLVVGVYDKIRKYSHLLGEMHQGDEVTLEGHRNSNRGAMSASPAYALLRSA